MTLPSPAPVPPELDAPVRAFLDRSPLATVAIRLDGRIAYANPAYAALVGATDREALLGHSIGFDAFHDAAAALAACHATQRRGTWEGPLVARRRDGTPVPVACTARMLDDADGTPGTMLVTLTHRDAPPTAPPTPRDDATLMQAVVGAAGVLIAVVDTEGRIVRVNGECERVSGWRADELAGRCIWDTFVTPDTAAADREAFSRMLRDDGPCRLDGVTTDWRSRDGTRRLVEWTCTRLADPEGRPRYVIGVGIDVTARREAERALRRSESQVRQFRQMVERSPQEVWIVGPDARIRYVNAAGAASLGYGPEELVGRPAVEIDAGGEAGVEAALDAASAAIRRGETSLTFEVEHLARDGRRIRKEILAILVEGDGEPLGAMFATDITERARQQAARAEYARMLGTTLDLFPGWVACVDDDLRYLYANETFASDRGLRREDIVGRTITAVRGEDTSAAIEALAARLRAGERVDHSRHFTDARGEPRTFWMSYRAQRDPLHPDRHVFFAFGVDVTEARRNERRLGAVLEGTRTGIWEWNGRTDRLWVNPQFPALVGARPEEAATPMIDMVRGWLHPDDRPARKARFRDLVEGRLDGLDDEFRVRHANGGWIWLHERVHVVARAPDGRPLTMTGMLQDVTARKVQEHQLHELNAALEARVTERTAALVAATDRAERASAAKTEFLSRMSHELRTPLNAILGFSQLLGMSTLPSGQSETVGEILRAGRHLLALIDEVLDLATVESGGVQLRVEAIAPSALVDECLALVRPDAQRARLRVDNRVDASWPPVLADRMRLRQVLLNLLSNAVKYNRPGGPLEVSARRVEPAGLELRVADGGPGLAADQVARLFRPFERLDAKRGSIPGTGIGLAVSKRLVELMGGSIGVDSVPGTGSTFWVRVPLADAPQPAGPDEGVAAPPEHGAPGTDARRRRRVLYVEDNVSNQRLMRHVLAMRRDIELEIVADPRTAVERARESCPELVLLDIQLPYIDGYRLLDAMRLAGIEAPVVAVSANAMPEDVARGEAAGFAAYLTKPLDVRRVLEVVGAQLGG
jgi:hypothetical protein